MKTIFYISCTERDAQYWYSQNPYKEWFTLDNILYQPDGNIHKETTISPKHTLSGKSIVDIAIINTTDILLIMLIVLYEELLCIYQKINIIK